MRFFFGKVEWETALLYRIRIRIRSCFWRRNDRRGCFVLKKLDLTALRKEQARILRSRGMSLGKTAKWTGLTKDVVRNIGRSLPPVEEDRSLEGKMENGEACLYCGADLPQKVGSGRRRRYCSDGCRRAYWKIHREEGKKKTGSVYTHKCAFCGKSFEVYGRVKRKYCSRHCFMLHRNGNDPHPEKDKDILRSYSGNQLDMWWIQSNYETIREGESIEIA